MATHFQAACLVAALLTACTPARPAVHRTPLRFAAAPDRVLALQHAEIRFRDFSIGEPVLLLHGYTDRLETMEGLADSLAPTNRIVTLDLRGFGSSTKYLDAASYGPPMLDDVVALLDHLRIRRVHVVGYSMGGLLAANLAERHPDRVLTATLVGGPFFPDMAAATAFVTPYVRALEQGEGLAPFFGWVFPAWGDSLLRAVSDSVAAVNDAGAMVAALAALPALTLREGLRQAPVPVLAVVGTDDPLRPLSRQLVSRWSGARLVELEGDDHESILTRPRWIPELRTLVSARQRTRPQRFASTGGKRVATSP